VEWQDEELLAFLVDEMLDDGYAPERIHLHIDSDDPQVQQFVLAYVAYRTEPEQMVRDLLPA